MAWSYGKKKGKVKSEYRENYHSKSEDEEGLIGYERRMDKIVD